jgi:hypothetical protein
MAKPARPMHELQMASPCSSDWEQMPGTDRVRRCGACRLNVYRVSDLTRMEAEEVVGQAEGSTCPSLFRRQDGTVLVQDCPRGVAAAQKAARWWKERVFHLFLLVLPWLVITGFLHLDSQFENASYSDGIWGVEPFKTVDDLLSPRPTAPGGLKTISLSLPPIDIEDPPNGDELPPPAGPPVPPN